MTAAEAQALFDAGRAAWPEFSLDRDKFVELVERAGGAADGDAAGLYLACACALGVPAALAAFEKRFMSEVGAFIARYDSSPTFADEVRQLLRERLLVAPPGESARIADYAGRGPLGGWLRVSAVRVAINLLQQQRRGDVAASDPLADAVLARPSPEVDIMKARYLGDYEAALRQSLATLTARERNVLRMSFIDRLSIDQIGTAYTIHRATAARWIERAQEKLAAETYRLLAERLGLSAAELDSLTAMVVSQLDVSLAGLLRS